jgi:hypothetical protein
MILFLTLIYYVPLQEIVVHLKAHSFLCLNVIPITLYSFPMDPIFMKWDLPNGKDSAASATHQYGQSHIKPIMALHDASNAHIVTNHQKVSRM